MPTPTAVLVELSDDERARLEAWSRRRTTAQALALRSRIVLAAADGLANGEIAERERVSRPTVTKWRNRFAERRLEGLLDEPRPGRPRRTSRRNSTPSSSGSINGCSPGSKAIRSGRLVAGA